MPKSKRRGKGGLVPEIPKRSQPERDLQSSPKHKTAKPIYPGARQDRKLAFFVLLPALLISVLLYLNTLPGKFVYDDVPQITKNTLIQDGSNLWRAMSSDVWAFKRGDAAVSNYWRPTFVLWLMVNFRLFGLDTFGWHLLNILLHTGLVALAFFFLRRLNLSHWVAGAVALLFAAHPVHTESVAWISGSPDLILSAALLASMLFIFRLRQRETKAGWALAILFYLIALGAKEIAVVYPIIVFVLVWRARGEASGDRTDAGLPPSKALRIALPFAALAVLYLIIRQLVLGGLAQYPEGGANISSVILSAPMVFTFYLRQIVFPYWIGPSYPLRAVTPANIGLVNFVIPLLVSLAVVGWMLWQSRKSKIARVGLALFVLPLLPAMNIAAFLPEQIVHDRYLYLPVLGFLMMTVPPLASLLERSMSSRPWLVYALAAAVCLPLGIQTIRYNRAWLSNEALWQWGIATDPSAAWNYLQYGAEMYEQKRFAEAVPYFDRALGINQMPLSFLGRGRSLVELKRFDDGQRDLLAITSRGKEQIPSHVLYLAYEGLAVSFERQGKPEEAGRILEEARSKLPQYRAALTEKLAVILYQTGKKQEAYDQLVSVYAQSKTETLPESRLVSYRIGLLAAEMGKTNEARAALQEFLAQTQTAQDEEFKQARAESEATLRRLPR
jgi:predicted negative regulator of RcsB-dependent stress response